MSWNTSKADFISYPFFPNNISRANLNAILELAKMIERINDINGSEDKPCCHNMEENDRKDIEPSTSSKYDFKPLPIENEEDIEDDSEDDSSDEDKIEHNKSKTEHNSEPDVIEQVKREHPSVFICNRLTFLIKTRYPIIWDTSSVAEPYEDCLFIALDRGKNPLIDMNEAAKISLQINTDQVIQKEIVEFLDGFRWKGIICTPYRMAINGENRFGFMFTLIND